MPSPRVTAPGTFAPWIWSAAVHAAIAGAVIVLLPAASPPARLIKMEATTGTPPRNAPSTAQRPAKPAPATPPDAPSAEVAAKAEGEGGPASGPPVQALAPSSDGDRSPEIARYLTTVRARIQNQIRYPLRLRAIGTPGEVQLRVTLAADGTVDELVITRGSEHPEMDQAALEAVRRAAPFAPTDAGKLNFSLPVQFRMR